MNKRHIWKWGLAAALVASPLLYGFTEETRDGVAGAAPMETVDPVIDSAAITNAPTAEAAERALENAPTTLVSLPEPENVKLSPHAAEILKLVHAGVDENVLLAFVTNSTTVFNLTADDIVYLNDIGVPSNVVTAMIQRDEYLKKNAPELASAPPTYTNKLVPAPGTPTPYPQPGGPDTSAVAATPQPMVESAPANYPPQVDYALTDYSGANYSSSANNSYTYFYDSLQPYGNWVYVGGYGMCWQPTTVVINRGWSPYCDNGRWVYSNCGWYWSSDYSWGWAPFHYGRWFRHGRLGWCWAPDTVWGPSWVSWRYTSDYCGWAPLPPTACYSPGFGFSYYGRSVGVSFSFGLSSSCFTFVPTRNFCDRDLHHHRVDHRQATQVYNNSVVVNNIIKGKNNTIINNGISVDRVSRATGTTIREAQVRDGSRPSDTRRRQNDWQGRPTVVAYRPNLPTPTREGRLVGEGVQPAPQRNNNARNTGGSRSGTYSARYLENRSSGSQATTTTGTVQPNTTPDRQHPRVSPTGRPLILRGSDRQTSSPNGNTPAAQTGGNMANPNPVVAKPNPQTTTTQPQSPDPSRNQGNRNQGYVRRPEYTPQSNRQQGSQDRPQATPATPATPQVSPATPAQPAQPANNRGQRAFGQSQGNDQNRQQFNTPTQPNPQPAQQIQVERQQQRVITRESRVEQPRVEQPRVEQQRVEQPRVEQPRVEQPRTYSRPAESTPVAREQFTQRYQVPQSENRSVNSAPQQSAPQQSAPRVERSAPQSDNRSSGNSRQDNGGGNSGGGRNNDGGGRSSSSDSNRSSGNNNSNGNGNGNSNGGDNGGGRGRR